MDELPGRVRRAFDDHGGFERAGGRRFDATTTPFDAIVEATAGEDGRTRFEVAVRVPALGEVTGDDVADVVEEGWFETFELRAADVGGVTAIDRDLDPTVRQSVDDDGRRTVTFEAAIEDADPRRGVDDAAALIGYVEGVYVQGIIPGYEYTEPVAGLIAAARSAGGGDGDAIPPG